MENKEKLEIAESVTDYFYSKIGNKNTIDEETTKDIFRFILYLVTERQVKGGITENVVQKV